MLWKVYYFFVVFLSCSHVTSKAATDCQEDPSEVSDSARAAWRAVRIEKFASYHYMINAKILSEQDCNFGEFTVVRVEVLDVLKSGSNILRDTLTLVYFTDRTSCGDFKPRIQIGKEYIIPLFKGRYANVESIVKEEYFIMPRWTIHIKNTSNYYAYHEGEKLATKADFIHYLNETFHLQIKDLNSTTNYKEVKKTLRQLYPYNHLFNLVDVQDRPEYPGGMTKLAKDIEQLIPWKKGYVEGKVFLNGVIDSTGHMDNFYIVRGINTEMDQIALSIITKLKQWQPAKNNGQAVHVVFALPIQFKKPVNDVERR